MDQWGVFLEHRLRPHLMLELAGTSSMGIHLYESYDINAPYPAPKPYNYARYPYDPYESRVGGHWVRRRIHLLRRPGQALRPDRFKIPYLLVTYRYAKSIDDASPPNVSIPASPPHLQPARRPVRLSFRYPGESSLPFYRLLSNVVSPTGASMHSLPSRAACLFTP